jgi:P27 family predicted phage terminase small subunit
VSTTGRKPRTLESRRAAGEVVTTLPVLAGGRPTLSEIERPPTSLDRWGKAAWREVVTQLVESKLIDRVDRQALEAYALHMGRARALREEIEWEHDETTGRRTKHRSLEGMFRATTARGFTSNPLLSQEREALREARMMGELLGLNPVGRTRLGGRKPERHGLAGLTGNLPTPRLVADEEPA